jgi:hypothetical protein
MRVDRIEVKRCFVASNKAKELRGKDKAAFLAGLAGIEREVRSMTEFDLDKSISPNWPPRLKKYNELVWYFEECSIDDLGAWYGAGELPEEWCIGSVRDTIRCIKQALKEGKRFPGRAFDNVPRIVKVVDIILNSQLLAPIVVPGGTWRQLPCLKMKGDIDDGCMRVIAFALSGHEKLKAYIGKSK